MRFFALSMKALSSGLKRLRLESNSESSELNELPTTDKSSSGFSRPCRNVSYLILITLNWRSFSAKLALTIKARSSLVKRLRLATNSESNELYESITAMFSDFSLSFKAAWYLSLFSFNRRSFSTQSLRVIEPMLRTMDRKLAMGDQIANGGNLTTTK